MRKIHSVLRGTNCICVVWLSTKAWPESSASECFYIRMAGLVLVPTVTIQTFLAPETVVFKLWNIKIPSHRG